MKSNLARTIIGLTVLLLTALPYASAAEMAPAAAEAPMSMKAVDLRLTLHTLWVGHIFWVRNVVTATHSHDMKAAKASEEMVVKNAKDIGGAVASFYGQEAGDKMFNLLAGHYGAVKEYMNATFKGDKKGAAAATDKATKNAEEIAAFLSSANPYLPKDTLMSLLSAHYGHHMAQINAVKAKDWSGEASNWIAMRKHIDVIADALSSALVKQFPDKF